MADSRLVSRSVTSLVPSLFLKCGIFISGITAVVGVISLFMGLFIGLFVAECCANPQSLPLDLKGAVQFAMEHSPQTNSAAKTQSVRQLEYQSSIAAMLPSLDLRAIHGLQNNIPIGGNYSLLSPNAAAPWYSSLSLSFTENLYDNGVSLIKAGIANVARDFASVSYEKARAALTRDIAVEFYNFSLIDVLVQVRQEQRATLEKQFRTLSGQYQQGLKTKLDFLRFKTQVQRSEIEVINIQKSQDSSRVKLYQLLGVDVRDPSPPSFKPMFVDRRQDFEKQYPEKEPDVDLLYDYRQFKLQADMNDRNVSFSVRKYWPQVGIGGSVTYSNLNYLNSETSFAANNQLSWSALLTLEYNFWDWGIRRRDVETARLNRDIQKNDLTFNLLQTKAEMDGLMIDLARLRDNYKLSKQLLGYEEENYRNIAIQYREGKVAYLDLITSLNNLLEARVLFYTSYFGVLQNLAKYQYFEGTIYEILFKE